MGERDGVAAVRSAVAALNDGDVERYLAHFHPDGDRWAVGLAQPLALTDIRESLYHLQAAFEGLHLHEEQLFGDERFVCARWQLQGLHVNDYLGFAPTRKSIDFQTCEVYEIEGELVVTTWVYGDHGQLFRQIAAAGEEDG
jgi:predicted ester cyclase